MRAVAFSILRRGLRIARNCGWDIMSTQSRYVHRAYNFCYDAFRPQGIAPAATRVGRIWVDADQRGAAPKLLIHGTYEPSVESALHAYVLPGSVVVDIGANVGYFARIAAKRAGSKGRVFAFEPDPSNFSLLERNSAPVASIHCLQLGVAAEAGRSALFRDHRSNTRSSLARLTGRPMYQVGTVQTVALDDWAMSVGLDSGTIDVVKIDVEGGELNVLRGASALLASHRATFIVELWPSGLKAHGATFDDVVDVFEAHNYMARPLREDGSGPLIRPRDLAAPAGSRHMNVAFLPAQQE